MDNARSVENMLLNAAQMTDQAISSAMARAQIEKRPDDVLFFLGVWLAKNNLDLSVKDLTQLFAFAKTAPEADDLISNYLDYSAIKEKLSLREVR